MRNVIVGSGRICDCRFVDNNLDVVADVDPMILARGTPGFSGADLQNMIKYGCLTFKRPSYPS